MPDASPKPPSPARALVQHLTPLLRAVRLWLDADGLRMSAAMSFYGMLSLAPLLLLIVGLLGWWVDKAYLESNLIGQVQGDGRAGAEVVRAALASAQAPAQGRLASMAGFVLLLSGGHRRAAELQSALERLWLHGQAAPERKAWWRMARCACAAWPMCWRWVSCCWCRWCCPRSSRCWPPGPARCCPSASGCCCS
jgi:membrane protein